MEVIAGQPALLASWLSFQSCRSLTDSCFAHQQCPAKHILCRCKIVEIFLCTYSWFRWMLSPRHVRYNSQWSSKFFFFCYFGRNKCIFRVPITWSVRYLRICDCAPAVMWKLMCFKVFKVSMVNNSLMQQMNWHALIRNLSPVVKHKMFAYCPTRYSLFKLFKEDPFYWVIQ